MIDVLPVPQDEFPCPCGGANLTSDGFHLLGMLPLARTHCAHCSRRFLAHLHTGFCNVGNFIFEEETGEVHSAGIGVWYRDFLVDVLSVRDAAHASVRRITRRPVGRDVVLQNCLDPVYGHCVRRLFSFDAILKCNPDSSVVAIVPEFLAWQVPEEIDEVWSVAAPLRECHFGNDTIARMADELTARADRLRYADMDYVHTVDISRYVGVGPFEVTGHESVSPPRLTLNWREDRCWTRRGEPLPPAEAVSEQLGLYTLLLETIRERAPDLDAAVAGYGRTGVFPAWVSDLRLDRHDPEMERQWAKRHAASHLTIGMHGSNMNIPAALSHGAIEIVPAGYWQSIAASWQWINRMNALDAISRYRQIPASSSVSDVVSLALLQLRRMQSSAGYSLIYQLRDSASPREIAVRHHDAFTQPEAVICRDAAGKPF